MIVQYEGRKDNEDDKDNEADDAAGKSNATHTLIKTQRNKTKPSQIMPGHATSRQQIRKVL